MNPSAPPSKGEKFDSLEKSYALLKDDYKTLSEKNNRISKELRAVKLELETALNDNSTLQIQKRNLGKILPRIIVLDVFSASRRI